MYIFHSRGVTRERKTRATDSARASDDDPAYVVPFSFFFLCFSFLFLDRRAAEGSQEVENSFSSETTGGGGGFGKNERYESP